MKKPVVFSIVMILALAYLSGCQQDPNSGNLSSQAMTSHAGSRTSHPALVWIGAELANNTTYSAIFVADTDLANITRVLVAGSSWSSLVYLNAPGWSPSGGSVCFTQYGTSTLPDSIKAFDVSVNSKGDAVSSNVRTIVGLSNQNVRLDNPCWSSTTTMGKIAYTTKDGTTNSLYVVSQSGGTPTKIFSVDQSTPLGSPTWNSDDSKLAVFRRSADSTSSTIMIYNTSNWTYVDSIAVTGSIYGLEWSRSGTNKLAFGVESYGSIHRYLYYCDPATGSTPSTNNVEGDNPSWSPNNSSVLYVDYYSHYLLKNVPLSASTTSVSYFGGIGMKWKR